MPSDQNQNSPSVGYEDIVAAANRLAGQAHRTPVMTSRTVDAVSRAQVFFKCENLQRIGAFKFRGAYNALSQLTQEQKSWGAIAYSSGNHAQAVALAARLLGIPATLVMPEDAPSVKIEATRQYGAEVVLYDRKKVNREALAQSLANQRGLALIPPFDHPHIIAGQGTLAKELFEDCGPLDFLFVPCGGGGLISGCAIAAAHLSPGCQVIGVEPENGDDGAQSFRTGTLQTVNDPQTVADGARTPSLGRLTFPLIQRYVRDITTVSDQELLHTMFFLWERMKLIVEPTGALGATALMQGRIAVSENARVGVVLSGGNVDLKQACTYL